MSQQQFRIAVIKKGRRGKATNTTTSWEALRTRLSSPSIDAQHTVEQFNDLSADERNDLKDVGSFVGGPFSEGKRRRRNLIERSVLTLDCDAPTPADIEFLKAKKSGFAKHTFFAHTTRSHSPDKPRWRFAMPLARAVSPEEYGPLARIVGSSLFATVENSMDALGDESFRVAQVMYWPSISSDQKFDTIDNRGSTLDPDAVLKAFGNWQDWTLLPFSEKRSKKRPGGLKKAEDPTKKRGLVGAFCRAYDVPAAIAKFLSDIYVPGDPHSSKPRYTYLKGQGANGAIVEDNGLFLYSHHGTDPCSERLVNAFDLVRIHLFGTEDDGAPEDTTPTRMPSFKKMEELGQDDTKVKRELANEQYDILSMFDDLGESDFERPFDEEEAPSAEDPEIDDILGDRPKKKWIDDLEIDKFGRIAPTLYNTSVIVQNDQRIAPAIEYNQFRDRAVTRRAIRSKIAILARLPIEDPVNGDVWEDKHDAAIRTIIEAPNGQNKPGWGMKVSERDLKDSITNAAHKKPFHPVREYLTALRWDDVSRVESLFIDYLGAEDNAYHREIATKFCVAAVARAFEPGHKFDFIPILQGTQGKRKSTFIRILAKDWAAELKSNFDNENKLVEQMLGHWIMEIPELAGFARSEVEEVKAFVSATENVVRLAWDRRPKRFRRQCVFIGSTNSEQYLLDTENRRWWPVVCEVKMIDTEKLEREVDQIWAEAVAIYRAMRQQHPKGSLPLYLGPEAHSIAVAKQEESRVQTESDILAGIIQEWLDKPQIEVFEDVELADLLGSPPPVIRNETSVIELWTECLGNTIKPKRMDSDNVTRALRKLGWQSIGPGRTPNYGVQKVYRRP